MKASGRGKSNAPASRKQSKMATVTDRSVQNIKQSRKRSAETKINDTSVSLSKRPKRSKTQKNLEIGYGPVRKRLKCFKITVAQRRVGATEGDTKRREQIDAGTGEGRSKTGRKKVTQAKVTSKVVCKANTGANSKTKSAAAKVTVKYLF